MTRLQAEAFLKFCQYLQGLTDKQAKKERHEGYGRLNLTPIEAIEEWADRHNEFGVAKDRAE